jgi:hypothetical protein
MVGGAVCLSSNNIRFGSFADIGASVRLPLKADFGRDKPTTTSGPLINRPYLNFLARKLPRQSHRRMLSRHG